MPELKEFAPVVFPEPERQFAPVDFGTGQGRSEQKFVPENNSIVNMPVTSSPLFDLRESRQFIEGQEELWGNTPLGNLFAAPGGVIDPNILNDLRKLPGGIIRTAFETAIGGLGEAVALALEEREVVEVEGLGVIPPLTSGLDRFIQNNPELAQRFNEKMLDLQEANEDFLIRNGLIYGPDDQPTILGNALSQAGTSGSAIALAVLFRNPALAAGIFGVIQQVSGFQEAVEAGKEPSEAAAIGTLQGIIEAGVSFIGVNKLTKIIGSKSAGIVGKIVASMATEGIEEGVTEALIIGVQNATGVKDISLDEALLQIFQATFYGSLLGGGTTATITTSQAVVKRIVGDSVSEASVDKVARVMDDVGTETATEMIEQDIDDATTELEIGKDLASDQPVTKAAKTTGEQQKRVVEIMQQVIEGKEIDLRATLDEIFPEARIQRQKRISDEGKVAGIKRVTKEAIRREVVQLQAEIQIAEQQGDEDVAAEKSERIEQLRQQTFADESLQEAVEELEAEGIFVRGEEFFEKAAADIENVLRHLRVGERLGRTLQEEESKALQDSLTRIIEDLGKKTKDGKPVLDKGPLLALQKKVRGATTIASAERIRRDILSQARKSAFKKFISERRLAIGKTIKRNAKPKVGELSFGFQNSLDRLNVMRLGMVKARKATGLPPQKQRTDEQKQQAKEQRDEKTVIFNTGQSDRIAAEMDRGIPAEGLMLQVRYLDILNERASVTPQVLARFEDDLDAFIASGKGKATAATAAKQAKIDRTIAQIRANKVKTTRADTESKTVVKTDEIFGYLAKTYDTEVVGLAAEGTLLDFFENDVRHQEALNERRDEITALADSVSDGKGKAYLNGLRNTFFSENVIDLPSEGLAKSFGGKKIKNVKMTRGELVYNWMLLQEPSIAKQMTNPKGKMAWTPRFIATMQETITDQDMEFALGLFEFYNRSYERVNEVYRRENNRDLPRVVFYSHIRRAGEKGLPASVHNESMFADELVGREKDPSRLIFGDPAILKKRDENAVKGIKNDNVMNSLTRYIHDSEHYIAYAEDIALARKVVVDEDFVEHAQGILGEAGYQTFFAHLEVYARINRVTTRYLGWLEVMRQNQFKSTLLGSPKIGFGQLASNLAWAANMPKVSWAKGEAEYLANPAAANKILNQHPTFRNRERNFSPEIDQLTRMGSVSEILATPIRKGDVFAVRTGAWARYKWLVKEKGVSEKDALNQVARFAERSQQSVLPSQMTLAQKSSNPVVRAMTMYKSSLTAMLNVSMQSIIEYKQTDKSTPQKKAEARRALFETLAIQNVVIPAAFATLTGGPIKITALVGSLAGVAGIGQVLEVIISIVINVFADEDDRIYVGGLLDVPADTAFEEIQRKLVAVGDFGENVVEDGIGQALQEIDIEAFFRGLVDIVDLFTPFPENNALDFAEGMGDVVGIGDEGTLEGVLKALGYKTQARKRMLERIDTLTGSETTPSSGRVLTRGEFP